MAAEWRNLPTRTLTLVLSDLTLRVRLTTVNVLGEGYPGLIIAYFAYGQIAYFIYSEGNQ